MTSPREPYYDDLSYDSINKLLNLQPTELSSQEYDKLEQTGASYLELQVRKSVGHLASSIPDPAERVNTVRVALSWHFRDLTDEDVDKIYTRQPSLPYAPFRSQAEYDEAIRWQESILPIDPIYFDLFGYFPYGGETERLIYRNIVLRELATAMTMGIMPDFFLMEFNHQLREARHTLNIRYIPLSYKLYYRPDDDETVAIENQFHAICSAIRDSVCTKALYLTRLAKGTAQPSS
jgi:hypothetical protein